MLPVALTIAGSDPSGGAGIQADLKTFHRFGVYGEAVITLITAQNTRGVSEVMVLDERLVAKQLEAAASDIRPDAVKTGALGTAKLVCLIAEWAAEFQTMLVVDPVLLSKHGAALMTADAVTAVRERLLPRAFLITPNLLEAEWLTGRTVSTVEQMAEAARHLCGLGAQAALVKGGHLDGMAVDVLFAHGEIREFPAERIRTRHTHGTGCTLSAAITAHLAKGCDLADAVARSKAFITRAIQTNPGLGGGSGPVNHWA